MEHLLLPRQCSTSEAPFIPCLVENPCAGDDFQFLKFPEKRGIPNAALLVDPDRVDYARYGNDPSISDRSFLQEWLFFGLIREVLGSYIKPEVLVRELDSSPMRVLTTSSLNGALRHWYDDAVSHKMDPPPDPGHLDLCLRTACLNLENALSCLDLHTSLSYASVGELLDRAVGQALYPDYRGGVRWTACVPRYGWKALLGPSGYCEFQIERMIENGLDVSVMYFTSRLARSETGKNHDRCTLEACTADQIDAETYKTKHIDAHCKCQHYRVAYDDLYTILAQGYLPLLRISSGPSLSDTWVEIVSSKDCSRYVAISHVWAEGLGNAENNSLPRCQLRSLAKMIEALKVHCDEHDDEEILLWCDTMCCPAEVSPTFLQAV